MTSRKEVEQNKKDFPPGSKKAIENECSCPEEENCFGKGFQNRNYSWVIDFGCELHFCTEEGSNHKKKRKKG